jgi:hypothetical protein
LNGPLTAGLSERRKLLEVVTLDIVLPSDALVVELLLGLGCKAVIAVAPFLGLAPR